jgi:hypothetical protein
MFCVILLLTVLLKSKRNRVFTLIEDYGGPTGFAWRGAFLKDC